MRRAILPRPLPRLAPSPSKRPKSRWVIDPFREARVCECGAEGFVGLNMGLVAVFDPEDQPRVAGSRWFVATRRGGQLTYAQATKAQQTIAMHKLLGPEGAKRVDHRDGNRLNNRRGNLRSCTPTENQRNSRPRKTRGLPYKGIKSYRGRFDSSIRVNGRRLFLGSFDTPEDAARAYDAAALEHFGEFARTNAALGLLPPLPPEAPCCA